MKQINYIISGFLGTIIFTAMLMAQSFDKKNDEESSDKILKRQVSRIEAWQKYTRVISLIEDNYIEEKELTELIDESLKGLLSNLDAHSNFLDETYFKELNIQTSGEFGGLGITVGIRDGALTVIAPLEDTPADKAGIKAGDIIVKIDDMSALNITLNDAVSKMRGKPNTEIILTVVREGESKPLKIKIIRDIIKIDSVYAKTIDNKILYLRVKNFDKKVVKDIKKAITKYKTITQGIILDLRNNPGGLLNQAVGLVDIFVDNGIIVSQKGRDKRTDEIFKASKENTLTKVPLVILINQGSASASEIVTGALQDHKRAIVVGTKSFGKGSVQVILPISNKEGIKLTIAKYYLPSGRTIQAVGITPDIEVLDGEVPKRKIDEFKIKEADLKKHLTNELAKINTENSDKEKKKNSDDNSAKKIDKNKDTKDIITVEDINKSIQLKSAIDVLKALIIMQ